MIQGLGTWAGDTTMTFLLSRQICNVKFKQIPNFDPRALARLLKSVYGGNHSQIFLGEPGFLPEALPENQKLHLCSWVGMSELVWVSSWNAEQTWKTAFKHLHNFQCIFRAWREWAYEICCLEIKKQSQMGYKFERKQNICSLGVHSGSLVGSKAHPHFQGPSRGSGVSKMGNLQQTECRGMS